MEWKERGNNMGAVLDDGSGKVFISYQPNKLPNEMPSMLDSANPETAIVLVGDKKNGKNRYLIYRGDWREELAAIYPDVEKLKEHWKEHGGHFWSDDLDSE